MGGDDDINSNPAMKQGEPEFQVQAMPQWKSHANGLKEAIKRTENSLEVSFDVEGNNVPGSTAEAGSIIIGIDQDRSNRVDVLWRVAEGRPPDTDASVSDCVVCSEQSIVQFQQSRSRFIPQFQQKKPQRIWGADELGQGSQTGMNDPNENGVLLVKVIISIKILF